MRKAKPVQSLFPFLSFLFLTSSRDDHTECEFISPLTLKECVRRLRVKRPTRGSRFGFEVILMKQSPGCYEFRVRRQLVNPSTNNTLRVLAEVNGVMRWWDYGETHVMLKPARKYDQILWLLPVFALIALALGPSTLSALSVLALLVALGITSRVLLNRYRRRHANRKLIERLEEMLGDPVLR